MAAMLMPTALLAPPSYAAPEPLGEAEEEVVLELGLAEPVELPEEAAGVLPAAQMPSERAAGWSYFSPCCSRTFVQSLVETL